MHTQADLTIPAADDALDAAKALAVQLEAKGDTPHVMEVVHGMTGLAQIHLHREDGPDEVVLVHPQQEGLRKALATYQLQAVQPTVWRLAWVDDLPLDVATVFDPTQQLAQRIGTLTRGLLGAGIAYDQRLEHVGDAAAATAKVFSDEMGVTIDLDAGVDALRAIDDIVDQLRPVPKSESFPGEEAIFPQLVLYALALVACEVARRRVPGTRLGRLEDTTFTPGGTLIDAAGLPAVQTPRAILALGRKVLERFHKGDAEGTVELWTRGQDAFDARAGRLDTAVALLRTGLDLTIGQLEDEGTAGIPRSLALVDDKLQLGTLATANPPETFEQLVAKSGGEPHALVADAYTTNPANGHKLDSLLLHAAVDGEVLLELALPYQVEDGAVRYPYGLQFVQAFDHRYDPSRVAAKLLPYRGLERVERDYTDASTGTKQVSLGNGVSANIPEGLPPELEAMIRERMGAMVQDIAPPSPEQVQLLVKLGALAPFAMFMMVNPQGGANEARTQVFGEGVFADDNPESLHQLIGGLEEGPNERFAMLGADPPLLRRSLAAAGRLLQIHPDGDAGRARLLALAREVASADGDADEDVLAEVTAHLDAGQTVALEGGDPFGMAGYEILKAVLPAEVLEPAAFGPVAAFMFVAGADGEPDPRELQVFIEAMMKTQSPVLQALMTGHDSGLLDRVKQLSGDQALQGKALQAMAAVFQHVPGGTEAKNEFLETLVKVGEADGDFDANERRMVDMLARVFDGRPLPRSGPNWVVLGGVGIVALLVIGFVLSAVF